MNRLTLAVAGGRKTQSIIDACANSGTDAERILTITYTLTGQRELGQRLIRRFSPHAPPQTIGWWTFLIRHWVRPYLPRRFEDTRLKGFNFKGRPGRFAAGKPRYLDTDGRVYGASLAKLAFEVNEASDGAVVDRLSGLFDSIYIDEVQDLVGWDLEVLDLLFDSSIDVTLVGDLRQSVISTDFRARKNAQYGGVSMLAWFQRPRDGTVHIHHENRTWRCCQEVANLADTIFPDAGFPPTASLADIEDSHQGVFAITPDQADRYLATLRPTCLRPSRAIAKDLDWDFRNFGKVKGLTFRHVLIYPTKPIRRFLTHGTPLAEKSCFGLYVAVTRAEASVAFVVPSDELAATGLAAWSEPRDRAAATS